MQYRFLGNSGFQISEIAYGNWITHGSQIERETAIECVHAALESGITTFDTADVYANGKAEMILGEAIKGQRRESLQIFTKVYWPIGPDPKSPNDTGLSRKHILEGIDGSLKRLGMEYVDLYQAHRYDIFTPLEETMRAFADVVRAGKALYIGVSEWPADKIREGAKLANEFGFQLISSQPEYSMLWRVIEKEVVPTSRELGIGQIVWSPMAQGVLSGKYLPGREVPPGSRGADKNGGAEAIGRFLSREILDSVQELAPIAAELGITMAQLALAWVLNNDNVSAAIVGASRPDQVAENVKASGVKLPEAIMRRIDDVLEGVVERDPKETQMRVPTVRYV